MAELWGWWETRRDWDNRPTGNYALPPQSMKDISRTNPLTDLIVLPRLLNRVSALAANWMRTDCVRFSVAWSSYCQSVRQRRTLCQLNAFSPPPSSTTLKVVTLQSSSFQSYFFVLFLILFCAMNYSRLNFHLHNLLIIKVMCTQMTSLSIFGLLLIKLSVAVTMATETNYGVITKWMKQCRKIKGNLFEYKSLFHS